ncbi:MAG TPA: glycosyltransferase family 2 protein [Vicinamibacteria bacterium]|nr:glycosyltransferase family 2 protein [Vicinamibacteria bacterium]
MKVSVVVPTFNRGRALAATVERLAASRLDPEDDLEIVVVDDGSSPPAQEVASSALHASPWPVRWLRQANAGPAAARNAGFRATRGEITLFVDDDILVPPQLVRAHVAAHRARPGTVVFGACPFPPGRGSRAFRAFLAGAGEAPDSAPDSLLPAPVVASGQISMERAQFDDATGVYASDMVTPAAEEYELSLRLRHRGISVLSAPGIVAEHDQPVDIGSYCRQQYKHGVGCGEAASRRPELLELGELARIIEATRSRGVAKGLLARRPARELLTSLARALERFPVPSRLRVAAYRAAVTAHFVAGVRDGCARFSARREVTPSC